MVSSGEAWFVWTIATALLVHQKNDRRLFNDMTRGWRRGWLNVSIGIFGFHAFVYFVDMVQYK